jgi:peroxiredoxin
MTDLEMPRLPSGSTIRKTDELLAANGGCPQAYKTLSSLYRKSNQAATVTAVEIGVMRVTIAIVTVLGALALAAVKAECAPPAPGTLAPDFSLQATSGGSIRLSQLRGHVVVVNFFATWCPPCRAETPDMVAAYHRFSQEGVIFLGVDDREKTALVGVWAKGKGVTYPIVSDAEGSVEERYDVRAIPTTYVLDRSGVVRYRQVDQLESSTLASVLDAVVAGTPIAPTPIARKFDATVGSAIALVSADRQAGKLSDAITAGNKASDALSALQNAAGSSSIDYFRATQESDALWAALADAYEARAQTETGSAADADRAQAQLQLGQIATDREQFADAYGAYAQAVALDPKTASDAYNGMFEAAIEMKHDANAVAAGEALATAVPADPESWLLLASGNLDAKNYARALDAARHALALATATYANAPTDKKAQYELGRVWLKLSRVELAAHDVASARAELCDASAAAPGTIVAEQADEQFAALDPAPIAVAVSGASYATAATATPAKLWVVVRNPSLVARDVNLTAAGLPAHWLLSFCYAKVCQPNRTTISLAAGGSERIELQVIPLSDTSGPWSLRLTAAGGSAVRLRIAAKSLEAMASVAASTTGGT